MTSKPKSQLRPADGTELTHRFGKHALRMADGGQVSPWSIKGMANAVTKAFADTPEQARRKALLAEYKAEKAASEAAARAAATPAPAPAPAPTTGISGYVANGALARREAAAGLRDGGQVPGKGTGDKIPALYEPGEFVVSNDMLNAAPGLREQLHDLRGNVLAAKGKTVEEADAQAVSPKGLRAQVGWEDNDFFIATGNKYGRPQKAVAGNQPRNQAGGVGGLPQRTSGSEPGVKDWLRTKLPNLSAVADGSIGDASHAWKNGNYSGAAGHVLRGIAASIPATDIDAYNNLAPSLRNLSNPVEDFARGALGMEDRKPPVAAPVPAPAQLALRGDATMPGQDPQAPMADATSYLATGGRNGRLPEDLSRLREGSIYKTVGPNGNPIYSGRNISGDAPMLDGKGNTLRPGGNVSVVPAMSPDLIASTLRNPDGSKWSAADNAIMAANLRDGVNPYRGTSRAAAEDAEAIPAVGELGHNRAVAAKLAQDQLKATLRGQDIQSADNRYGHELSAGTARNRILYDINKDQRDFRVSREDKSFEKSQAADKAWTEHANTMFRTTDDKGNVVPDTAKAAAYTQFVDQGIGLMIPVLEQSGDPQKVAYAQRLKAEGRAALDAADKAELPVLFGRQQVHAQTIGSGPFSSGGPISMNPADYRITGNANGIFQERVKTKGGQTIPTTNLLYGPNANRFLWNTGEGSTALMPNKLRGE